MNSILGGKRTAPSICEFKRCSLAKNYFRGYSASPAIAIIGSGPAGFYTASRVLGKLGNARIDMYESLPVPFGLMRFGVAPDHPEVKNCEDRFDEVASSDRFRYFGNVHVGGTGVQCVEFKTLLPYYDAIIFAHGASKDKTLHLPDEDSIKNVISARAFVGWYNGLPEYQNLNPDLTKRNAVVLGQGNVALDVARILLTSVDALRHTDITDKALATLQSNQVSRVSIVGRRGPLQAAFTIKEIRELLNLPNVAFENDGKEFVSSEDLPRPMRRLMALLSKGSRTPLAQAAKSFKLDFLLSPVRFNAAPIGRSYKSLAGVVFERNILEEKNGYMRAKGTGSETSIPAEIAFRSIGYKSEAIIGTLECGIPFDPVRGIIPNSHGRVRLQEDLLPKMYASGWVKRGPTGVIATTMNDAFETADCVIEDMHRNESVKQAREDVVGMFRAKGHRSISWQDWRRIDAKEKERGRVNGKPREKFSTIDEMLAAVS